MYKLKTSIPEMCNDSTCRKLLYNPISVFRKVMLQKSGLCLSIFPENGLEIGRMYIKI